MSAQAKEADMPRETYLGDGLFAKRNEHGTVLLRVPFQLDDGLIELKPEVLAAFLRWLADERLLPGQETHR